MFCLLEAVVLYAMEPVYNSVVAVARTLFAAQGIRFRVTGSENIPTEGGAVIVMNHLSYMDFAYAGLAARPSRRLIRFMCKKSVWDHPIAGPLMSGMKHIPVDRENGSQALRDAVKALKAGELVGVFPEATISRSYELKEFKTGAIRMAQATGVPIIPIVLWGTQRIWTKGHPRRLGYSRTPISLTVGKAISAPKQAPADEVSATLRAEMQLLLDHAQAEYPRLEGDDLKFLPARLGGTAPTLAEANEMDRLDRERRRAAAAQKNPGTDNAA
ncbi:1-acyl-sn-glycerol-3-phosphate acyltransferase [Dermatophilus congolensis]|uniref:1-acyl-sn-glycerol-3-phosphate acyltransferase n=2 Tax=Dermatophilus congolensis TaxID=1863 RepID=A0A239VMI6_9MICO|nr:1-acyl-sn-glycerol-3-phosphate acyltransferase [Dermatophilus congolensis]